MMKSSNPAMAGTHRKLRAVAAVAALTIGALLGGGVPAGATASSSGASDGGDRAPTSTVVTMEWNCEELTEADRQKAITEGIKMCGLNEREGGIEGAAIHNNNCGTAIINVGQAGGRANIHYALHSSQGFITGRGLDVWWGPTYAGGKYDFGGFWGTSFYGSALNIGYGMGGQKFGATMSGWVTILGWTLSCNIYVTEPVRKL